MQLSTNFTTIFLAKSPRAGAPGCRRRLLLQGWGRSGAPGHRRHLLPAGLRPSRDARAPGCRSPRRSPLDVRERRCAHSLRTHARFANRCLMDATTRSSWLMPHAFARRPPCSRATPPKRLRGSRHSTKRKRIAWEQNSPPRSWPPASRKKPQRRSPHA